MMTVDTPHQIAPRAASDDTRLQSVATRWAGVAFALAFVVTALLTWGDRRPLAGEGSIGDIAAWSAAVAAGVAFGTTFVVETSRGHAAWRQRLPLAKRVVDVIAMTGAMVMLSYFIVLAAANLFQLGFIGLTIDPLGGGVLAGAAAAAFAYAASLSGARVTSDGLATLATLVLFVGTMASMLSAPDESWWQLHFSQLGNSAALSGYRFNLALIVTGIVLTALAGYIGHDIERGLVARGVPPRRTVSLLSWLFAGIGICLSIAGFVPDAVSFVVHVGAASGMVVVFGVFVFCALRFLPGLPREVASFSVLVIVGILIAAVLWVPIGYYNLTGMEFIAAGLLFAWLLVFVRATAAYAQDPEAARDPGAARDPEAARDPAYAQDAGAAQDAGDAP
ncbi:DUF998 domain-containing protein [Microbacterium sp. No. 7]|uniref:DUF998 domain-containing protein n=1 Tax=Microbacterium sp. No. 7 TaxID=1714373 RepID=UPI0012E0F16A|nr:DUF998 domain-containing protein [Microbacterium sp. No. 7]